MQGALENILCGRLLFHIRAVNDSTLGTDSTSRTTLSWRVAKLSKSSAFTEGNEDMNYSSEDGDEMDDAVPLTASVSLTISAYSYQPPLKLKDAILDGRYHSRLSSRISHDELNGRATSRKGALPDRAIFFCYLCNISLRYQRATANKYPKICTVS